jgi:glutamate-1-semialdehyde 2,1-aminomutase
MAEVSRERVRELRASEQRRFVASHPRSLARFEQAKASLVGGVPMNWMQRWPGGVPVFVAKADGAHFVDVDGLSYVDFCLGDTGAMTGHSPAATVDAIARQAARGITTMLPTEDAIAVGAQLQDRFGLPFWQIAMTATDANRFVIRLARHATGRSKILVFNWCYHGTVDETLGILTDGAVVSRPGDIGPPVDPALTTKIVEFNDVAALEAALAPGDVACVLAEPALTNIGIVAPDAGFHDALREITRRTGTLLVIDETHTICVGPGGATRAWGLDPDFFVIGKPIAGGMPAAAFGMTAALAERLAAALGADETDVSGIGGTLTGNALALAAIRATLDSTLLAADYERMIPLATRWAEGVRASFTHFGLAWSVNQLGARAEYWFSPSPRNGAQAAAAVDAELDSFMHLWALNRGILLTPFHNMALMSPSTTAADVDAHTAVFHDALAAVTAS